MDRIDSGGTMKEIKDIVDKNAVMTEKNAIMIKRMTRIIIPMLGVLILGVGLTMGVLSGYLLRLPHQQTNGSGQVELSKPAGTYASKLHFLYCYMNMLFDKNSIIFLKLCLL